MDLFEQLLERAEMPKQNFRPEPWRVSPWVAMSALQKAIRRNHKSVALRAASTLLANDPRRLWRRLLGICFEDVGLGAFDRVQWVVESLSRELLRGQEWSTATRLVELLCAAPKDRSADDLFITATCHPQLAAARLEAERISNAEKLMRLENSGALLSKAVIIGDLAPSRWKRRSGPSVASRLIWSALSNSGSPAKYVTISEAGYRKTREVLPMMVALLAGSARGENLISSPEEVHSILLPNGLPAYALDGFSHEGKASLLSFLKTETETARWFRDQVRPSRRGKVLGGLLFRVEGSAVNIRLRHAVADALRDLADNGFHGDHDIRIVDAASLLRADFETLNDIRSLTVDRCETV
ncbi:hypothetical protein HJA90_14665 [Rhizobium bangladeshense]|uniref:hypothetical protein n=1 Tax=Rhizobium bangladeshense TaxID=1138189 RepID=UPI001C83C777|nr:hypothetical protein [Rhizobium bangladeshense]MBX4884818.1 hypothetical protein [Rhizobium bangladeshense]